MQVFHKLNRPAPCPGPDPEPTRVQAPLGPIATPMSKRFQSICDEAPGACGSLACVVNGTNVANGTSAVNSMNTVPVDRKLDQFGNEIMGLDEIGLLNSTVRIFRYPDCVRLSRMDLVMAVTGQSNKTASKTVSRLATSHQEEVTANCRTFKFKGPGQQDTTLITISGALKLIMALPGINAREMRTKFASVLQRYFAGDPGLVGELAHNNASSGSINALAREDLGVEQVTDCAFERRVRIRLMEAEIKEKEARTNEREIQCLKTGYDFIASLCAGGVVDERTNLFFKDQALNLYTSGQRLVANGEAEREDRRSFTISSVLQQRDIRTTSGQLIRIGRIMARLYFERYGDYPSKHEQFVDGGCRPVNTYYHKDIDLLDRAVALEAQGLKS